MTRNCKYKTETDTEGQAWIGALASHPSRVSKHDVGQMTRATQWTPRGRNLRRLFGAARLSQLASHNLKAGTQHRYYFLETDYFNERDRNIPRGRRATTGNEIYHYAT